MEVKIILGQSKKIKNDEQARNMRKK